MDNTDAVEQAFFSENLAIDIRQFLFRDEIFDQIRILIIFSQKIIVSRNCYFDS